MLADFFVLSLQRLEGERFAIVRLDDWIRTVTPLLRAAGEQWLDTIESYTRTLDVLTEESARERLAALGLAEDAVSAEIVRARNLATMSQGPALWETVSDVGYRNEEGQQVVARTAWTGGEPVQRLFVMRCSVCGHEYGTLGCEIPHRCCPNCQDGEPGLATG